MHRLLMALGALAIATGAHAATVYKSVDAQGRVSYSDQPPAAATTVEVLDIAVATPAPDGASRERIELMREVTDRMAADRRAREAQRAAARTVAATAPRQVRPEQHYYYPIYRRAGPGYRPPPVRPVQPQSWQGVGSYPAKLIRRGYTSAAAEVFQ